MFNAIIDSLENLNNSILLEIKTNNLCKGCCNFQICENHNYSEYDNFWYLHDLVKDRFKDVEFINIGSNYLVFIENTKTKHHKIIQKIKGSIKYLKTINNNFTCRNCSNDKIKIIKILPKIKKEAVNEIYEMLNIYDKTTNKNINKRGLKLYDKYDYFIIKCENYKQIDDIISKL